MADKDRRFFYCLSHSTMMITVYSKEGRYHNFHSVSHNQYHKNGLKRHDFWYVHGKLCRYDGPAIESHDSSSWNGFWLHNKKYSFKAYLKRVKGKISEERYNYLQERYGQD